MKVIRDYYLIDEVTTRKQQMQTFGFGGFLCAIGALRLRFCPFHIFIDVKIEHLLA